MRSLNYPVVIHKDRKSDYGVTVPDLPGCFSAGSTLDEALVMTREAIELHLEGMAEDGERVPKPSAIDALRTNPEFADGAWAFVTVDADRLPSKAVRVNVTLPDRVLRAVDRYAKRAGETRSGLLAAAASEYIGRRSAAARAPRGPRPSRA